MTTAAKPGRSNRPGSVRYRKDRDAWEARVRLPNGTRPSAYFKTERPGWNWISRMISEVAQGRCVVDSSKKTGDVFGVWLEDVAARTLRPNSLDNYRRCIDYVLPWIGDIKLKDLTRPHIERTFAGLAKGDAHRPGFKPATLNLTFRVLKMALEYCVDAGYRATNPMHRMKAPRVEQTRGRVLSDAETEAILQESHGTRWEAAFYVLAATGMRPGELLGLEWENIDLAEGSIRIERQTGRVHGEPEVRLCPLKTSAAQRTVKVPAEVCRILQGHADVQRLERKRASAAGTWEEHGTVFCGPSGKLYFRSQLMHQLRRMRTRLGIRGATLRTFRHTASTRVQAHGLPLKDAQALLGHATARPTLIYSHPSDEGQRRVAEVMERTFAGMHLPRHDPPLSVEDDITAGGQAGGQSGTEAV